MAGKVIDYTIRASLIVDPQKAAGSAGGKTTSARAGLLQGEFKALKPMVDTLNGTIGNINKNIGDFNVAIQNATKRYSANNVKALEEARTRLKGGASDIDKIKSDMVSALTQTLGGKVKNKTLDLATVAFDDKKLKALQKEFDGVSGAESLNFIKEYRRVLKALNKISIDFASIATDAESQERALQTAKTARNKVKATGVPVATGTSGPVPPTPALPLGNLGVSNQLSGAASSLNQAASNLNQATATVATPAPGTSYPARLQTIIKRTTGGTGSIEDNLDAALNTFNIKTPTGMSKENYYIKKLNAVLSNPDLKQGDLDALRQNDKLFSDIEKEIQNIIDIRKLLASALKAAKGQYGGTLPPELETAAKKVGQLDTKKLESVVGASANKAEADALKKIEQDKLAAIEAQEKAQRQIAEDLKKQQTEQSKALKDNIKKLDQTTKIADGLKKVAKYTLAAFSIYSIQYGIRKVFTYITDLDKAMTNIGVVTGYTRKELQAMTSTMNSLASTLGRTTKEIAEASLLFYQQGKSAAEVTKLVEATVKSAAIAMIDAKEASSQLTAALNGYSLTANDAMRVADIFAKLAGISAADFQELSAALTKTASQSNTVGMSIETTTAFLAKMIEVTRESPENLGTAWKTITARYAQFNKDPNMMVDDEPINKVGTALASVGIEALDTSGELRNFDEVILELGGKWEGLSRNVKQYLATALAGSRQQSRFLALMNDFDRTLELVSAAENSAGEANAQYTRHMQGMEASLNRLQVAIEKLQLQFVNSKFFISLINGAEGLVSALGRIPPVIELISVALLLATTRMTDLSRAFATKVITQEGALGSLAQMKTGGTATSYMQRAIFNRPYQAYNKAQSGIESIDDLLKTVPILKENKADKALGEQIRLATIKTLQETGVNTDEFNKTVKSSTAAYEKINKSRAALVKAQEELTSKTKKAASDLSTSATKWVAGLQAATMLIGTVMASYTMGASGDTTGGMITGVLGGALSGAMLGTAIAPGVGTAVGAVGGAVVAGVAPLIAAEVNKDAIKLKELADDIAVKIEAFDKVSRERGTLQDLYTEYQQLDKVINKNAIQLERFYAIQNEIQKSVLDIEFGYNSVGERIITNTKEITKQLELQQQIALEKRKDVVLTEYAKKQEELKQAFNKVNEERAGLQNAPDNFYARYNTENNVGDIDTTDKIDAYNTALEKLLLLQKENASSANDLFVVLSDIEAQALNLDTETTKSIQNTLSTPLLQSLIDLQANSETELSADARQNLVNAFVKFTTTADEELQKVLSNKRPLTNEQEANIIELLLGQMGFLNDIDKEILRASLKSSLKTVEDIIGGLQLGSGTGESFKANIGVGNLITDDIDNYEQILTNITKMQQTLSETDYNSLLSMFEDTNKFDWKALLPTDEDFSKPEILKSKLDALLPTLETMAKDMGISVPILEQFFESFYSQPILDAEAALTQFDTTLSKVQSGMQENGTWQGSLSDLTTLIESYGDGIDLTTLKFDALTGQIILTADAAEQLASNIKTMAQDQFASSLELKRLTYLRTGLEIDKQAYILAIMANEQFKNRIILLNKENKIKEKQAALDKYTEARSSFISLSEKIYAVLVQQITDAYQEQIQLSKDKVDALQEESKAYDEQIEQIQKIRELQDAEKNLADLQKQYATLALQGPSDALFALEQDMMDAGIAYRDMQEQRAQDEFQSAIDDQIKAEEDRQQALQEEMDSFLENYEGLWERVDAIIKAGWGAVEKTLRQGDDYIKAGAAERLSMTDEWKESWNTYKDSGYKFYNDTSTTVKGIKTTLQGIVDMWGVIDRSAGSKDSWVVRMKETIAQLGKETQKVVDLLGSGMLQDVGAMAIASRITSNPSLSSSAGNRVPEEAQRGILLSQLQTLFPNKDFSKLDATNKSAAIMIYESLSSTLKSVVKGYFTNVPKGTLGYSLGGLVSTTGPAMLHGTQSKPEAVLNPLQTQAFMALVNSMVSLQGSLASPASGSRASLAPVINIGGVTIEAKSIDSNTDLDAIAKEVSDRIARKAYGTLTTALNPRLGKY